MQRPSAQNESPGSKPRLLSFDLDTASTLKVARGQRSCGPRSIAGPEARSGFVARSLAQELVQVVATSQSLDSYRQGALALMRDRIGFDLGVLQNTRAGATGLGFAMDDAALSAAQAACARELTPLEVRHMTRGHVIDAAAIIARRRHSLLSACRRLWGGRSVAVGLFATSAGSAGLVLARAKRAPPFGPAELAALDALLPLIAVAENLHTRGAADPFTSWATTFRLTPRQREIADLAVRGLTNVEIARVLGCSEITARNHLVAIFKKAGVSTRGEVAFQALTHVEETRVLAGYAYFERHAR